MTFADSRQPLARKLIVELAGPSQCIARKGLGDTLKHNGAASSAMSSLMAELLEGHIRSHILNGKHKPSSQQIFIGMVKSYLKWTASARRQKDQLQR